MNPSETLVITPEEEGLRLDLLLKKRYENVHSRTYFEKLIEQEKVLLNGEVVKKRIKPKAGDEVEVCFLLTPDVSVSPEPIPLDILYEDEAILVVNKPAGLVVHPAPGNWTGTFVNALLYHVGTIDSKSELRPGIVHRLDKDTTGVLIAAKTELAHTRLIESFSKREVKKTYLAICRGNSGSGRINLPIGRHPVDRKKMAVIETGRPAITEYKTLSYDGKTSVVEVNLITGRTHQIRVHMKALNHPIIGDQLYGGGSDASRQLLHAKALIINHPITGEKMEFIAPIPDDFKGFL